MGTGACPSCRKTVSFWTMRDELKPLGTMNNPKAIFMYPIVRDYYPTPDFSADIPEPLLKSLTSTIDALNSKFAVDLVVTDVRMPGNMDGFALAEWVRANRGGVEVILCSADPDAKDRANRAAGLGAFLAKPYTGRALLELVKQALAKGAPEIGSALGAA